jgi:Plavaka transposase
VEFQLAEFIFNKMEMSASRTDELMELIAALLEKHEDDPPFRDNNDLLSKIDEIKLGEIPWESFTARYDGELPSEGPAPEWMTSDYEVFFRDPQQIIHNMLANPDFDGGFDYSPYQDFENEKRRWSDFMSGNWAWKQAVRISTIRIASSRILNF